NTALNYKPKQLEERGGAYYSDTACKTIAAIYANKNTEMVVSTRNNGAILDLPSECTVEVTTYIGSQGARTVSFGSLPTAGY
ncbi:6-phospho-beta-glucosidase, partial [Staphylococcus lugdunensis]|nr:6-phospho-beta-glucosidase [Staphylococcus lugdunensis]